MHIKQDGVQVTHTFLLCDSGLKSIEEMRLVIMETKCRKEPLFCPEKDCQEVELKEDWVTPVHTRSQRSSVDIKVLVYDTEREGRGIVSNLL